MTLTSAETTDGALLEGCGQRLIKSVASVGERAAAQALVEEETILARENVQRALGLLDVPSWSEVRWEGLMGRVYGLGLDEEQRAFLGLVLSMVGIGHVPLAAVSDLDERRLAVMLRAVARLAGNDTLAVGTRI
ncbi:hypothetical protein ACFYW9_37380 [Streptomyces sp. NPDC002698]|uniref:hypothetical protein n=1 Tax=Streptomyces sp. NPDC002698 TaxID=3364660 RepID=UPI0036B29317